MPLSGSTRAMWASKAGCQEESAGGALFLDELNSVGLAKGRGGFWHRIPPRYVAIPVPLW